MERTVKCENDRCPESIRVVGSGEPSPDVPEILLDVECPACGAHNLVKRPTGRDYHTGLAEKPK
jgi:hypothetical protein